MWDSGVYIRTRVFVSKTSPKSQMLAAAFLCDCDNLKALSGSSRNEGLKTPFFWVPSAGITLVDHLRRGQRESWRDLWRQRPVGEEKPPLLPLLHQCEAAGQRSATPQPWTCPGMGEPASPHPMAECKTILLVQSWVLCLATIINVLCKQRF